MRILIVSRAFLPLLGGIETTTDAIARAFARLGHDVAVVTDTPSEGVDALPYAVDRKPSPGRLIRWVRWCDVCVHNNISVRSAWPLAFASRPWVVVHQTFLRRPDGSLSIADRVKRALLRRARSIAISNAVARDLPVPATIVPNPYRDDLFRITNAGPRPYELGFLGRLVPDKGADLLLAAVARLREEALAPRLLLIGSGPEEGRLRAQSERLGLCDQVVFAGAQSGPRLVDLLNDVRILVVPSLWPEPFGIVAVEAIACGCAVIGSEGGGLPEAIGPCGVTFPNGDVAALARRMRETLRDERRLQAFAAVAPAHLARHTAGAVAEAWLGILTAAAARRPRRS